MKTKDLIALLRGLPHKGIIFDFDGTLYNLAVDWPALKKRLEKTMYKEYNIVQTFTPYIPAMASLKNQNIEAYNRAIRIVEEMEYIGLEKGQPNNELLNFVQTIKGKKFGAYTMNTTTLFHMFLKKYNLVDRFDIIATQQTCIAPKPAGEDLLHMARKWRYNNTQVIFVGNSHYDKKSGELAGIRTEIIDVF